MIYTDEQFKIIEQAKPHFESVRHEVIRNAPKWLTEQIINVYEQATKKHLLNKDLNCAVCVMNIYKVISKTYFDDLKERETQLTQIEPSQDDLTQIEPSPETQRKQKDTKRKISKKKQC